MYSYNTFTSSLWENGDFNWLNYRYCGLKPQCTTCVGVLPVLVFGSYFGRLLSDFYKVKPGPVNWSLPKVATPPPHPRTHLTVLQHLEDLFVGTELSNPFRFPSRRSAAHERARGRCTAVPRKVLAVIRDRPRCCFVCQRYR